MSELPSPRSSRSSLQAFWDHGGFARALLLTVVYWVLYTGAGQLVGVVAGDLVEADNPLANATSSCVSVILPIMIGAVLLVVFVRWMDWSPPPCRPTSS